MKTAVIYARYSSERQTEQSIEGQIHVCEEYAKQNQILILDTYIDRAMTGTNDNRPDFKRMISDSEKRNWNYILVYKFDRFSRNKYETAIHKRTLKEHGVKVLSATEHIPDSPEGIIFESMLEGYAEYYSAELSQKVRRGMNETRRKGNYTGGHLLYGYKKDGKKAGIFGRDLMDLERADISKMAGGLKDCRFKVACDVKNPLYGVNGASVVFGPQKGADEKTIQILDKALFEYSILAEKAMGKNMAKAEGAGAAGGLGFAFIQFLNASLEPGIDLVLGILEIEKYIKGADIVVTGEGRIDFQTAMGKAPAGVAAIAGKYGVPVIAFCGCTGEGAEKCNAAGIDAYFPIVQGPVSLKEAMENENAQKNLYSAALQALRLVKRFRRAEA